MQFWFKMILLCSALFAIGWFVSFQYDPYRVCVDHPDPTLTKDFYLCQPFEFTMQKGTRLERPADDKFIWEKHGDVIIGSEDPRKKIKAEQDQRQRELDQWDCTDEFSRLTKEEFSKLSIEDLNKYCKPKVNHKQPQAPKVEDLPKNTQDL